MRFLKWIFILLAGLVAVVVIGGLLLPRHVTVSRSVEIAAAPDVIFPHFNSLRATQAWSPWLSIDPDVEVTFDGAEAGVGAKMAWQSDDPNVGQGSQEITASIPNQAVETALDFGAMGTATARFDLTPAGENTTLTWSLVTDMGAGPVGRWMGLMMDGVIGPDYERGLANIKALVEG